MPSRGCGDKPMRCLAAVLRGRRGAAATEFALIGGMLMMLLIGTMELGRYMFTLEALRTAAAEAARAVMLRGSANMIAGRPPCTGLAGSLEKVTVSAPFLNPGALSVSMSDCATQGGVTTVRVTVEHPFAFTVPLFGDRRPAMRETALSVFQ